MENEKKTVTYRDAGVDIQAGDTAVDMIRELARSTFSPNVLCDLGGFGGLFSLKGIAGDDPVLVSGTDGVGTKLKIAFMSGIHNTIGIDAVAMCVNDVLCAGARPLFFLDYIATGRLEPERMKDIISGIAEGCRQGGCALIGGEMAEMPGFYADGEYDIAGFCVGIAERSKIIDGSAVRAGDVLLGLPSSGLHSNGFSLVRKVVFDLGGRGALDVAPELGNRSVGEALLEPTLIYSKQVSAAISTGAVKGIAHITGGGLEGNIERLLPNGCELEIKWGAWARPPVFDYIQRLGNVDEDEMRRVFNLGIGLVFVVSPADADAVAGALKAAGSQCVEIGRIR